MRAAVAAGAGMINDVYALRREGALDAAAELGVPVILMHMLGEPRSMQDAPRYDDVVADVHRFLAERIFAAEMAGIEKKRLVVDPGFGFGKNRDHNLALLAQLQRFTELGVPLLAGLRSEEHTSELQSLMRTSYAVLCLKKKHTYKQKTPNDIKQKNIRKNYHPNN